MIKVLFKDKYKIKKEFESDGNYICIGVFDKLKVKVEANGRFPIDLKCTLLVTNDD